MDSLCFKAGISFVGGGGVECRTHVPQAGRCSAVNNGGGVVSLDSSNTATTSNSATQNLKTLTSRFSFNYHPLRSLWTKGNDLDVLENQGAEENRENESWVLKILHVRSLWKEERKNDVDVLDEEEERYEDENVAEAAGSDGNGECSCCNDDEGCSVEFDRDSFSKLLRRVSLTEAKLYARLSYLGNLAYTIPRIKSENLLKHHRLSFVTSSLEKKGLSASAENDQNSTQFQETEKEVEETMQEVEDKKISRYRISASAAYHIAASAASYLQSQTMSILPFNSPKIGTENDSLEGSSEVFDNVEATSSEEASFIATTDSVTAVVAAEEEMKQAVAKDLNLACPSPCEWFICDDDESKTRFFVIQGSESLASWQANLLFEPIQFEGLDVPVHRGIYEAAKGIYEQMLPEVRAHIKSHGDFATFRFTGHSLGGSLSLLINLMLLIRGEVPGSSLLPVIMFGAPYVMCGGDQLLRRLGLPHSHVQAITMHRDIVPRAFSCNYPDHVAEILKAVNGNFRNHPCLQNQKILYAPMGDILILQPEENFSPQHHLLPSGSGLYLLTCPLPDSAHPEKHLQAAISVFFNSPHPLEILSDRSAYGSDGAIYRDHDVHSYLKCVLDVIRLELNQIRKSKREHRRQVWRPLIAPQRVHSEVVMAQRVSSHNVTHSQPSFFGIFHNGRDSLKRFSRFVASQHMHLLVVLWVPARLLVFGTFAIIQFR
ncbi:hypothetical protein IFM89_033457 [Coptis chinensis]|uniref:Fungal lipase-type domain-containing protein n=1 Tax=Coptis chinensis TaxID=261450 RepID=A0A835HUK4_9MAGN|nr:hypothetical protein IFM89_033457 [Coptis chinensis]